MGESDQFRFPFLSCRSSYATSTTPIDGRANGIGRSAGKKSESKLVGFTQPSSLSLSTGTNIWPFNAPNSQVHTGHDWQCASGSICGWGWPLIEIDLGPGLDCSVPLHSKKKHTAVVALLRVIFSSNLDNLGSRHSGSTAVFVMYVTLNCYLQCHLQTYRTEKSNWIASIFLSVSVYRILPPKPSPRSCTHLIL